MQDRLLKIPGMPIDMQQLLFILQIIATNKENIRILGYKSGTKLVGK